MPLLASGVRVAVYDEVTYRSATGVTNGMLCYFVDNSLQPKQDPVLSNTITAARSRGIPGAGNIDVSGSHKLELAPETIGFWLRHCLGAPTTTGASAPYTHVFRNDAALPVGLLLERNWITAGIASKVEQFLGCRVNGATIDVPQQGAATISLDLVGADHVVTTAPLDGTLADPGNTGWYAPEVTVNLAGSASTTIKSAQIKIANNLQTDRYALGTGGKRADCPEGYADVSGTITVLADTTLFSSYIDKAIARTDTTLGLVFTKGAGTGASAGNEKLTLLLDHALIARTTPAITAPHGFEVTFNFTAYRSGGTDKGLVATLLSPLANTLIS